MTIESPLIVARCAPHGTRRATSLRRAAVTAGLLVSLLGSASAQPLGTAFTYQGQLADGGSLASGGYDLRFTLFDAAAGGAQVGPVVTREDVPVAAGLFTVSIDFGPVFGSAARFLEVAVRPGASTGTFVTVGARQAITPVPVAVHSQTATTAATAVSATTAGAVPWGAITGKPTAFADNVDNDTLAALSCAAGQMAKWNGTAWACAADSTQFGGSGTAVTAARSDHTHVGASWSGDSAGAGLTVTNTSSAPQYLTYAIDGRMNNGGGVAVRGAVGNLGVGANSTISVPTSAGVLGTSALGDGVVGHSLVGNGVSGVSTAGSRAGVQGATIGGANGDGVFGLGGGTGAGVRGSSSSATGFGGSFDNTNASGAAMFVGAGGIKFSDSTILKTGKVPFANWASNGCATGQFPKWSGTAWQCGQIDTPLLLSSSEPNTTALRVVNSSDTGRAIEATSNGAGSTVSSVNNGAGSGLYAASKDADGIYAESDHGAGIYANSTYGNAIEAYSHTGYALGVVGGAAGLYAENWRSGTAAYIASQCCAAYFNGNVAVIGTLTKSAGAFRIDHPLDPTNKYLSHSFVESPDMKNVYDGVVVTDEHGEALVRLPDYFDALNGDVRYQLTVIGRFAQAIIAEEVRDNQFAIRTSEPRVKVSWQVTGIRRDAYALAHPVTVEEEKPADERGTYLAPEAFGQSSSAGLAARLSAAAPRAAAPSTQRPR